jgi:DNA-binding Xre family transcriptional regulator
MKKHKNSIVVRNSGELAEALGLKKEDAIAMEFRARLNKKIVDLATARGITHAELARRAGASRTRITAILNGQTLGASTDFLLRILYALGCKTVPTFTTIRSAA